MDLTCFRDLRRVFIRDAPFGNAMAIADVPLRATAALMSNCELEWRSTDPRTLEYRRHEGGGM
jgi:hypothetical protein